MKGASIFQGLLQFISFDGIRSNFGHPTMYKIVAKIKTKIRLFHHGHKYRRFVEISFASEIFLFIIYEYWK